MDCRATRALSAGKSPSFLALIPAGTFTNKTRMPLRSRTAAPSISATLLADALRCQSEAVIVLEGKSGVQGFRILFANDRFRSMTGYSAKELLGKRHGLLHTDPGELERMRVWAGKRQLGTYTGEGDLLRQDGCAINAAWSFNQIDGGEGSPVYLVAIYRDMTEKHRLQDALMLSQRLDAIGRMAGGVAHDFNNLVSVINGYSQMLALRLAGHPDELRELEEIQKAGIKAAGLTRQLLALGRRQPLALCLMDVNQFVQDSEETLARVIGDAGKLEIHLTKENLTVKADPDQMQQVLLNLVLNARDALRDKGKVTVSSSIRNIAPESQADDSMPPGRYAVLTVSDNGMGMNSDTLAHIFEPFFTTKTAEKGSGLGLALVYGIVQQSGGFIKVNSTLLLGSTFDILLPLVDGKTGPVLRPTSSLQAASSRGHETVLLVEPDIIVAKMLSGMLAAEGYHVLEASSAGEAESVIRKEKAPVHLLIASMGDDEQCLRLMPILLTHNYSLRVLCTAFCGKVCHVEKSCGECHLCMPKPFAISEMLKAVRKLLDS